MIRPAQVKCLLAVALALVVAQDAARGQVESLAQPLVSWNEGPTKTAILDFVRHATTPADPKFIPEQERLAVFDNDGTLWPENPVPFELAFVFDRVKEMAAEHPEWKNQPPFRLILEDNYPELVKAGKSTFVELLLATHAGMTTTEFDASVDRWIRTAQHPRFNRPYTDLAYRPMLELLTYLRANGFQTFIVSGGGAEFMRVWTRPLYGIPTNQVLGTLIKTNFELGEGEPVMRLLPEISFIDDRAGKPVAIQQAIGRRPVAAFGNSDGDLEMLQWTTIGRPQAFGLIVHHTDAEREWAYDAHPKSSGKLVEALREAPKRGWTVVDMKRDWRRIYVFEN